MKIAFVGKGGVGKTLLSSLFARWLAKKGDNVFAVDVDSNPNLAFALGVPDANEIISLTENEKLIKERTELPMGLIKLNPTVKDLADKYAVEGPNGIKLLVAGHIETSQGCMCGAHSLIKALLRHLTIKNEHIIFDMQAGLESFGRGTIQYMNGLVIVSELASRSLVTVERIVNMSKDMDLTEKNLFLVFNKAQPAQLEQAAEFSKKFNIPTAVLPYSDIIVKADLQGSVSDILETEAQSPLGKELEKIFERVIAHFQ